MKLRDMLDKRANLIGQMKDLHNNRADSATGNLAPEDMAQWDNIDKEVNELTSAIQREERLNSLNARSIQDNERKQEEPDSLEARYTKVFNKLARANGDKSRLSPEEILTVREYEKRTQVAGTPTAGGFLVPESWGDRIIERMVYYGPMFDENVSLRINTSNGVDINWPTNDDTANEGVIIGENAEDSKVDLVFGNVALKSYKLTSRQVRVSHELLEDNIFDLEGYIAKMLGKRLGRGANKYLTIGTGSDQPQGIVTGAGVGKTATANNAITRTEIVDLIHSLDRDYRYQPTSRLMLHDTTLAAIKKLSLGTGDDRPLWQPSIREGEPDRLEGMPYLVNNAMLHIGSGAGSRVMLAGDFSEYAVRVVNGIRIKFSEHVAFDRDAYAWVAYLRFDGKLLQPNAAKVLRVNPT